MPVPAEGREAAALERTYAAKARAELAQADALLPGRIRVKGSGNPLARVLLVKGAPGPADLSEKRALAGADGDAAAKALEALGRDPSSVWALCSRPLEAPSDAVVARLRRSIEAVDPAVVLALDRDAAADLAAAAGLERIAPGRPANVLGRIVGAVDGLEASLEDRGAKARVWAQMRSVFAGETQGTPGEKKGRR